MKTFRRILTLCLALVLTLDIMAMPASAVKYDTLYLIWTEEEFWDLSIPRPVAPDKTYIYMYILTKGDTFDYDKAGENAFNYDPDNPYKAGIFRIMPTCDYVSGNTAEEKAAAKEAYDRIADAEYKAIIAEHFGLNAQSNESFAANLTEESVYQTLIGFKDKIPEGTSWTVTGNYYKWSSDGSHSWGCGAFAGRLSDAAFGLLPLRKIENVSLSDVRVGDILVVNNEVHVVIVLEVKADSVVIAEGNYNGRVHWGRTLSKAEVEAADYMYTRWPEGSAQEQPATAACGFADVPANAYYAEAVKWAVEKSITTGTSASTFSPEATCTTAQILTFLWRACGSPKVDTANALTDVSANDYYYDAAQWAKSKGMISGASLSPNEPCTRASTVMYIWQAMGKPSSGSSAGFTDVAVGADYAAAVAWAVENGVTGGTSATTFSPADTCTRGQIVTLLNRAFAN